MVIEILLVILGMLIAYVMFDVGYKIGLRSSVKDVDTDIREVQEAINDFPTTLDGKFYSREAAIRQISMERGDD